MIGLKIKQGASQFQRIGFGAGAPRHCGSAGVNADDHSNGVRNAEYVLDHIAYSVLRA